MGYQASYLDFLNDALVKTGMFLPGLRMCELGNQKMRSSAMTKYCPGVETAKDYFESLGVLHTSVDWNGKSRALKRDLGKPLPIDAALPLLSFDVVTNSGTSEHVYDQYECFRNIHRLVRPGGLSIHLSPMGDWKGHGAHGDQTYTFAFFRALSFAAGYWTVLERRIVVSKRHTIIGMAFRHARQPFPPASLFASMLQLEDYDRDTRVYPAEV